MSAMPTDEERREVAARLREYRVSITPHSLIDYIFDDPWRHNCCGDVADRLADLIDPTGETCELELTWGGQTNAHVCTYECTRCGKSCDNVWGEDYKFCPYCGRRINHADE